MPNINLLPWRETLKKERETRFAIITGIAVAITGVIWLGVHLYVQSLIDYQQSRNSYLEDEIKIAEKQIKEIEELEKKKEYLINRMNVIQELESNRSRIVHLFDELVTNLPDGVYFTTMKQKDDLITLSGVAQSDARVSSLMRQIEQSDWLGTPRIKHIRTKQESGRKKQDSNARSLSEFELTVKQTVPKEDDESLGE